MSLTAPNIWPALLSKESLYISNSNVCNVCFLQLMDLCIKISSNDFCPSSPSTTVDVISSGWYRSSRSCSFISLESFSFAIGEVFANEKDIFCSSDSDPSIECQEKTLKWILFKLGECATSTTTNSLAAPPEGNKNRRKKNLSIWTHW